MLATAARRMRDLDPGSSLSRRLDGVRRFVWTNTQMTLNGTRPLLAKFCESNVRLMLIKGAARLALAPQLAADRLLRDIDVLVHPDDWSKALELADQNGWRDPRWPNLTTEIFPYHHGVEIQDDRRCTIDLHHLALYVSRNAGDDDALWERARPVALRGLKMFAPSPADEVLIAIVHGLLYAGGADPNADWILDIVPLIRSGDVDWDILETENSRAPSRAKYCFRPVAGHRTFQFADSVSHVQSAAITRARTIHFGFSQFRHVLPSLRHLAPGAGESCGGIARTERGSPD